MIPIKSVRRWYDKINAYYFRGKLPKVPILWGDLPKTTLARTFYQRRAGSKKRFQVTKIVIDRVLSKDYFEKPLAAVLLHEMAHVKLGVRVRCEVDRGAFEREMHRLVRVGAFDRIW